jgi:hypothetical protein
MGYNYNVLTQERGWKIEGEGYEYMANMVGRFFCYSCRFYHNESGKKTTGRFPVSDLG